MKALILAGTAVAFAAMPTTLSAHGAWCAEDMNARNCGFYTLEQCRAAASGLGAGCYPNQFAARTVMEPRKPDKRIKHVR
jgi:Protein of unknown function (DUF3551)